MKTRIRITLTGAAGQIGYALIFQIASGQMFGDETEIDLRLLELEAKLPALFGIGMELQDCAFSLLKNLTITSNEKIAMDNANWVIMCGAMQRTANMERSDLLKINGAIFKHQGNAINDYAASNVRILVVGNPCNTNALIAMNNAKDIPKKRFFAMTTLDELRARSLLAHKAQVDITEVTRMTIWGNHSATQFPDFYQAKIKNKSAMDVICDLKWLENDFISTVQHRGTEVIKARGAGSAASAANAILFCVKNISTSTPRHETYSLGLCSEGEYEIDKGLIFSFPCFTENGKIQIISDIDHPAFSQKKINETLAELRNEKDIAKTMGLIT